MYGDYFEQSVEDEILAYREKLRSLARGWGKTATDGELISLLCCPKKIIIISQEIGAT